MKARVKVKWDRYDLMFIRKNYGEMTLGELLEAVNGLRSDDECVGLSGLRCQLRRMGLFSRLLIKWSSKDVDFLKAHYRTLGNLDIASRLTDMRRSFRIEEGRKIYRSFTAKNIWKKLKLLGFHRTKAELSAIRKRNMKKENCRVFTSTDNCWTRGNKKAVSEEETRIYRGKRFVKVNGKFVPYARWFYRCFIGEIPPGYRVYHKDMDLLNDAAENLVLKRGNISGDKRETTALELLRQREVRILKEIPLMRYSTKKDREAAGIKHAELNRVRGLMEKLRNKQKRL
jgi:hypothetical protein